ncbi:MAG: hypothetical protein II610_05920 [Treponema sp.]|nr:hypothetical protein [Treponema sp.]
MTKEKLEELSGLIGNEAFMKELASVADEQGVIPLAKKYGVDLSQDEVKDLFTITPDTRKWAAEVKACADKLQELLKDSKKAEEFTQINSEESFKRFCASNDISAGEKFLPVLYAFSYKNADKMQLSEEELDAVVGGVSVWGIFKFAIGLVPFVGTLAQTICDLADGSLRGTGNIAARFALSAVSAMFGAVGSLAESGLMDIASTLMSKGFSAIGGKAVIWATNTAVSAGTGMAVDSSIGL